jgi:hypothetical protein
MIREWPGQTKEEWLAEYERDKNLTPEERDKELEEYMKQVDQKWKKINAEKNAEKQRRAQENPFKNCDHPNSLENSEATILWIIVMAVGTIFKGNWIIWIVATVIWWRYITRHSRGK